MCIRDRPSPFGIYDSQEKQILELTSVCLLVILTPMDAFDLNAPLVFSVTALNNYLRELLETDEVLQDLWVRGEISLSLIHISEPTRLLSLSYAVFCLKNNNSS